MISQVRNFGHELKANTPTGRFSTVATAIEGIHKAHTEEQKQNHLANTGLKVVRFTDIVGFRAPGYSVTAVLSPEEKSLRLVHRYGEINPDEPGVFVQDYQNGRADAMTTEFFKDHLIGASVQVLEGEAAAHELTVEPTSAKKNRPAAAA